MSPVPEFGCTSGRQCAGKALVLTCDGCGRKFHGHLLTVVEERLLCRDCEAGRMVDCTCAEDHAASGIDEDLSWWCWMFGCRWCATSRYVCGGGVR